MDSKISKNTIIIYEYKHHGNTKKLVDQIRKTYGIQAATIAEAQSMDLERFDAIGLASGIAFGKFYKPMEEFAEARLPQKKSVFFLYTCGNDSGRYAASISRTAEKKGCRILGTYGCRGYDTYGPFRLIGGIAKGHPTQAEVDGAVAFVGRILG